MNWTVHYSAHFAQKTDWHLAIFNVSWKQHPKTLDLDLHRTTYAIPSELNFYRATHDLESVRIALGHTSLDATLIYMHTSPDILRQRLRPLSGDNHTDRKYGVYIFKCLKKMRCTPT